VTDLMNEPYSIGATWDDWIDDVRNASGLTYLASYGGASYFRDRYGLKAYVNWLMDRQFAKTAPVPGSLGYTPRLQFAVAQPVQSVKDAVRVFAEFLESVESNDKVGLVVYGTNGASDPYSATSGLTDDFEQVARLPYPHQAGEEGRFTNTAEAIVRGYHMIHGPGSRPHAHKVIVFMSDGFTTVNNHFDYPTDLDDPGNLAQLQAIESIEDFNDLIGGFPSSSLTTEGAGSTDGREETIGIARVLASNKLGMGAVEFIVVGVGADADMEHLLQPVAAANGGEAYHAAPDVTNPGALPDLLKSIYRRIGGQRPVALIHPGG
jgi:hypothetical protein